MFIQEALGRVPADDGVSDLVGMFLVAVSDLSDTPFQGDARSLLDDMGGLVGGCMQIG